MNGATNIKQLCLNVFKSFSLGIKFACGVCLGLPGSFRVDNRYQKRVRWPVVNSPLSKGHLLRIEDSSSSRRSVTTLARASTWRNRQSRDVWSLANTKLFIVHCWKRERASSARVPGSSLDFHLFRQCRHDSARVEMPVGMLVVVSSGAFLLLPRSASAPSKGTGNDRWRAAISSQCWLKVELYV